jgi:hypothetical protein
VLLLLPARIAPLKHTDLPRQQSSLLTPVLLLLLRAPTYQQMMLRVSGT